MINRRSSEKAGVPEAPKLSRDKRRETLRKLGSYIFRYKGLVAVAVLLVLSSNITALIGPAVSGDAIDVICDYKGGEMMERLLPLCIILLVIYFVSGVLSYLQSLSLIHLSQRITRVMRKEIFTHLTELSAGYFDTHQTGDIISHISYDVDTVNASISSDLVQVCGSVITVFGSLFMMARIQPVMLVIFLLTVPCSVMFARHRSVKIRPLFRTRAAKLGQLNGYAEEMLSGQRSIRAYRREKVIVGRFDERNNDAVDSYYRADYHGAVIGPAVNFINNISIALITMLGGIFYMLWLGNEQGIMQVMPLFVISLGGVSKFVQYSRKFSGPINEFANIMNDLQSALSAAERVFRLLDEKPERADDVVSADFGDVGGEVDFSDVSFGYDPGKTIIHDLNIHAPPGSTVAIVGPTGAGKTTIINLLMRFYDVNRGCITVDGLDVKTVSRSRLRRCFTMVLQDTWLFCGSIRDNIAYGREGASDEEIVGAARSARIDSFIESLPDGYDTVLSDDGINLSKGQKQLITIARAMLSDSPMLILDEATSNVDSRTEINIQKAMRTLMKGRTCFVIAHRLSTIQNADVILVLRDGKVIEQGSHDELMKAGGFYSSLYNSQFF